MIMSDTLERVRKLLAKAERAGTPEEAEAFTGKAAELMARHGIDQAVVDAGRDEREREAVTSRRVPVSAPYAVDKSTLLFGVAEAMRCSAVRTRTERGRQSYVMTVFGVPSDLDRVEMLFTSLLLQATRQAARTRAPRGESTAAYRRTFLLGFTSAVVRRITVAEQAAVADVAAERDDDGRRAGAALVLVDRSEQVDRAVRDAFPNLRTAPARRLSGSGYGDGREAGERADVGASRVGGGARRALGAGR